MAGGKSKFGGGATPPGRPDHDDFWALSSIALMLDGLTQGKPDEEVTKAVNDHLQVDPRSIFYLATQRALHAMEHGGPLPVLLTGSFMDGFAFGIAWQKHLADKQATPGA